MWIKEKIERLMRAHHLHRMMPTHTCAAVVHVSIYWKRQPDTGTSTELRVSFRRRERKGVSDLAKRG